MSIYVLKYFLITLDFKNCHKTVLIKTNTTRFNSEIFEKQASLTCTVHVLKNQFVNIFTLIISINCSDINLRCTFNLEVEKIFFEKKVVSQKF